MKELYALKEMLCDELKEYGSKDELSAGTLDIIDKLSHSLKNVDKIIDTYEEESGGNSYLGYPRGGVSYRDGMDRSYDDGGMSYRGGSYARGRGRNARRDSMGRYSGEGYSRAGDDMVSTLHGLMQDAPSDQIRQDIQRLADKISQQM